jgi:tripartite-type tricarboxylate transporter receptor subunit TctC
MRATSVLAVGLAAAAATVAASVPGLTQAYPNRTIQLIVAYAAGGTGDIVARSISDKLGIALGQSVVVENRAGASGAIGAHSVTSAAPDGFSVTVRRKAEAALEKDAGSLGMLTTIGEITIGCALGYLDFRYANEPWRPGHPKL